MTNHQPQVFNINELSEKVAGGEPRFFEFLRVPTLSAAVYRLPANSRDRQAPHLEEELYFVVAGRAKLRSGERELPVYPGTVLYIPAGSDHSFVNIDEDLTLMVVFGASQSGLP